MAIYRVQARLANDGGLPEDDIVNVWHFNADDLTNLQQAFDALITFYGTVDTAFSSYLDATADAHTLTAYDLADSEPRAPVLTDTFTTADATGSPLPGEVAICMSFQAAQGSGSPQARRRCRVYLGPIDTGVVDANGRPASAVISNIVAAGQALMDASDADPGWYWGCYSTVDDAIRVVTNGWVDNEFDTQRRRGARATSRSTFS